MESQEVTETDARLMISKIVCENFKSYAGIRELGPFHKCFTSIVGPNGSGKSNVIDSMLFVFGYRAKQIRSKKVSVLIHNSELHMNIQSCTVSVHFQKIVDLPGDRYNVIAGSEFIVSRTAYTDNSSHYQLNGRKVPFKEVAALLRRSGIDLDHNRFLILQGEVEQIAQMKPKAQSEHDDGMLEFLEDIIGTSTLKEPIEGLSKKVEELGEARTEKLNRVKVTEKEKSDLEGAKDEAEHCLSLQREKAKKQRTLYSKYIAEYGKQEDEAAKLKEEADARVKDMEDSMATHSAKKKESMASMKKASKSYAKLEEEEEQHKAQIASCETKDIRARQDLKNAKNNLKKQSKALGKEKQNLAELIASPEKLEKEIKEAEEKIQILEVRKVEADEQLTEAMAGLKTATQGLQEDKEELELQLVDLNKVVNETKSKFDMAKAELDMYKKKINSSADQLKNAEKKLATLRSDLKGKRKEKESTEKALPGKKQALKKAEGEIQVVVKDYEKLSQQLRERRGQVGEARSALESYNRRGQVLQSLMQQKEMGNLPGVHGRLGDLGAIEEKYDIAISTACGALDNIVVDTMDTAVKCVEFLRRNNLGVSTFIGLDKIEHLRSKATSKMTIPEDSVRLFDLVKSKDPLFLTAFYFALRDTLVARDLDQATRIGLQGRTRYRVVTLSGQLVDTAGTMSGGGNRPIKGRMSSKLRSDVSPQELTGMEKKIQQDEEALEDLSRRRGALEGEIKSLKSDITSMEKAMKQLSRDVEVMGVQEGALAQRIEVLHREAKEQVVDHKHLAGLEKTVEKTGREYEKAAQEAKEIQDQVDSLHEAIMDKGKSEIQPKQRYVEAIRKDMEKTKEAMAKARVAIKTTGRNTAKCRKKVSSLEEEVKEVESRINELQDTLSALEQEAKEVTAAQEKLRVLVTEREAELSALKGQLDVLEKEEGEVQGSMVDLRHERDKHATSLKDYQQKIKYYKNEIKKLRLDGEGEGDEDNENSTEMDEEHLLALDRRELECEIAALGEKLEQMTPNMAAIEEYRRKEEQHKERLRELDQVTGERDDARNKFDELRKDRLDRFMKGFSAITNKLKEMYQMITLGGDAELELVDSLDPFSEGIVFSVRPPKKSWKNISNLSGGEKTLSSLALVFALHHYKPSPLYVMDEIDAALDFKNVSIVAHYIKERTKNAQFIIISLRNNMFELADRLVGIYKTHNATKSITIDPYKLIV